MKILLCPDKFKGSLSAEKVCQSLRIGLLRGNSSLQIRSLPMADGGDGSIDILQSFIDLTAIKITTIDPLAREIEAEYYITEDSAYIELASASGLVLLNEEERNPLLTTTRGTGEILKDAIDRGFKNIYLFIGGSATNDAGMGIAQALGYDFLDKDGNSLKPIGINLEKIDRIVNNSPYDFEDIDIHVLCDVANPMYGPNGAAHVYGAQKGALPQDVLTLDKGLKNFADLLNSQRQIDLSDLPGIGAAGAVGAALVGLLNATLENGFQLLSEVTNLEEAIKNTDLVITGEGKIDHTSIHGKVVGNVIAWCEKYSIPYGIVGGIIEEVDGINNAAKFAKSIVALSENFKTAMTFPEKFLEEIGREIGSRL